MLDFDQINQFSHFSFNLELSLFCRKLCVCFNLWKMRECLHTGKRSRLSVILNCVNVHYWTVHGLWITVLIWCYYYVKGLLKHMHTFTLCPCEWFIFLSVVYSTERHTRHSNRTLIEVCDARNWKYFCRCLLFHFKELDKYDYFLYFHRILYLK